MDAKKHPLKRYENRAIRERPTAPNVGSSGVASGFGFDVFARSRIGKNSGERFTMASTRPSVTAAKRSARPPAIFRPRPDTMIMSAKPFWIAFWATSSTSTPSSKLSSVTSS